MDLHKILMIRAYQRLSAYGNIVMFNVLLKEGGMIDVFGFKKHKNKYIKTGIIITEDLYDIEKKLTSYKDYFDKIIIATFNDISLKIKHKDIWKFPRSMVNEKEMTIYEFYCLNCEKIFYGDREAYICTYCGKTKCFDMKCSFNREDKSIIELPDKYMYHSKKSKLNKIKILKNPKFIENYM